MTTQITLKRALAAIGVALVYALLSVQLVRSGILPVAGAIVFVLAGILFGLAVALTRRRQ